MPLARDGHTKLITELTAGVVVAYVSNNVIPMSRLGNLVADIHAALSLTSIEPAVASDKQKPAVSIRKSVQNDEIICLECGKGYKSLKRHLTALHSTSPDAYRVKWELPAEYPMIAAAYSQTRSRLALAIGLGHNRRRATD